MPVTTLITSDEFLALPIEYDASGNRVRDELVRGEVIKIPPPSSRHDVIKNNIGEALAAHLRANRQLGRRALLEIAWRVSDHDTFVPDVSVFKREKLKASDNRILIGAPEIAIEVISPTDSAAHIKDKVKAYLDGGSLAVWVVYPNDRSMVVHTPNAMRELKADQIVEDPLLPGFSAHLSEFFEDV